MSDENTMHGGGWAELTTTALLGTGRQPLPPVERWPDRFGASAREVVDRADTGTEDPAALLLDLAALATVYRRAGGPPSRHVGPLAPPPSRTRPAPPTASCRRAADLLRAHGEDEDDGTLDLFHDWMLAVGSLGYRAPDDLLIGIRRLARGPLGRTAANGHRVEDLAATLLDERAAWLDALDPDAPTAPDPSDEEHWTHGTPTQRATWFAALRASDPRRAGEVLAATWRTEKAAHRKKLLPLLGHGLGPTDEPFLERALTDRSEEVRDTAHDLLIQLPGSAHAAAIASVLEPAVSVTAGRKHIRVEIDPSALDGASPLLWKSSQDRWRYRGKDALWAQFHRAARSAPLSWWRKMGVPEDLSTVRLKLTGVRWGGAHSEMLEIWAAAAIREGDGDWARALIDRCLAHPSLWDQLRDVGPLLDEYPPSRPAGALLDVLDHDERLRIAVDAIDRAHGDTAATAWLIEDALDQIPAPWPPSASRAALDHATAVIRPDRDGYARRVLRLLAHRTDIDVEGLAGSVDAELAAMSTTTHQGVEDARATLATRIAIREELS